MQSRKSPGDKVDTPDISQSRGTGWHRRLLQLTWTSDNMTVRVALTVLVTLLLAFLMVILCPSPVVHDAADRVVLQPLMAPSSSLTGSPCGDHSCSFHYHGDVSDALVTTDRRLVLAISNQKAIVVQSSSGVQTVKLGCHPDSLTQLPSGLIAVTCPRSSEVLLVRLDASDHQIQHIRTGRKHWSVTAHPVDNTLIVGSLPKPRIDVITLQGEVVRTLLDSSDVSVQSVVSLTVADSYLLVTDGKSKRVHRIHLSDPSPPLVETLMENLAPFPCDTAVDKAGNVFVVLGNGDVVMRTPEGHYRTLLTGRTDGETYVWCHIALRDDRLLVVNLTSIGDSYKSDVTEYQLVTQ